MSRIGYPGQMNGGFQLLSGVGTELLGSNLDLPAPQRFWRMDQASGNETDTVASAVLTANNSPGSGTGQSGNCRTFNGTNQFFNIANNSVYQITGDWTLGFWVKTGSLLLSQPIIAKTGNTDFPPNTYEWQVIERGADSKPQFSVSYNGSAASSVIGTNALSASAFVSILAWFQSSDHTLHMQVNGNAESTPVSLGGGGVPNTGTVDMWVGKSHLNFDAFFSGSIDSISIWTSLLTSTQRSNWYNGGTGYEYYSGGWH